MLVVETSRRVYRGAGVVHAEPAVNREEHNADDAHATERHKVVKPSEDHTEVRPYGPPASNLIASV